jgi:hypothetical protein
MEPQCELEDAILNHRERKRRCRLRRRMMRTDLLDDLLSKTRELIGAAADDVFITAWNIWRSWHPHTGSVCNRPLHQQRS